ncbi:MAG TPA: class I SAM-dependent methyltransferase [Candidatus Udaeobacter sp.]|nr:class I SAM-dependent methyltransferase [Candidatus Udaeobacter sp.]
MNAATSDPPTFTAPPRDARLTRLLKGYPAPVFSEQLYQSIELMERYSIDLAIDLLRRLDVIDQLDEWRSANELCDILSFQPRFTLALSWILERLVETGCMEVRVDDDTRSYHLRRALWEPDLAHLRTIGLNIDPGNAATLDLLDHATSLYPAVARGEQSGDQSLIGPQGIGLWLNYFNNDNLTYAVNNWVGAVLAADRLSTRHRLRILEVGAGSGSASEALLRCFDERGLLPHIERYFITEPNAFFRRRGQRELAKQYPDLPLKWDALDINSPWDTQGVASGEFDLVYAVNVLHISKDLLFSLNQARSALKGNGWLVIGECLRPHANQPIYPELMFQILESFTEVQTDPEFRPNPGFLTANHWRRAFTRAGFQGVEVAPDIDGIREIYPHFFTGAICAQNTATTHDPETFRG